MSEPSPDPLGRRPVRAAAAVVALAAVAVYAGTLGHGFVLDDGPEVVDNLHVRSLASLPRLLVEGSWEGTGEGSPPQYRPLTSATYALEHALWGLRPAGYHAVNVLLHAGASVLVLLLALALGMALPAAALAGLVFAVHPVHVEAVANVAGRKDVLSTLLVLAAVLAHRRAMARGGAARALAPLAVAAAAFSKESGVTVLGVLAVHDLLFAREEWRRAPRRGAALWAAHVAATALYLAARWRAVGTLGFPTLAFEENPLAFAPAATRVLTAVAVIGKGLALLVAPVTLSPDYSFRAIPEATTVLDPRVLATLALVGGLLALALRARRGWPIGLFALLWYGGTLFPTSNLLVRIGTIFGERLLYLPSVGFCLVAGGALGALLAWSAPGWAAGVADGPEPGDGRSAGRRGEPEPGSPAPEGAGPRRWARLGVPLGLTAVLLGLSARTLAYARDWRDEPSLYASAARTQPDSGRARRLHGGSLMEQGRPAEAALEFRAALAILSDPSVPPGVRSRPRLELGVALEQLGRLDEAAALYAAVSAEDPGNADAPWRTGVVRWREGRRDEAVALWRRAVELDPRHARALSDLGIACQGAGDLACAKASWRRATEVDPTVASVWYRLGNLLEREGDLAGARAAWSEFLRRSPGRYPEWRAEAAAKLGSPSPGPAR